MRVLLTGSEGFIGSAFRRTLAGAGHEVVPVDLLIPQAHGRTAAETSDAHRLDVREARDSEEWSRLLAGVDAVCHQAAVVGVETGPADLPDYASHNDLGTAALLAAMAAGGVGRLVLASSMVVYGEGRYACAEHGPQRPGRRPADRLAAGLFEHGCPRCGRDLDWLPVSEDAGLEPRSAYAASKTAQEHYAAAWARQTAGRVLALRYHNVYGPGMPRDTSYCGVAAMFRSRLEAGQEPLVFEDGRQTRDFVHVDDVAAANLLALAATGEHAEGTLTAYNIASGRPVTVGDVARIVAGDRGPEPVVTGSFRAGDVRHVVASPEAAARGLGFRAAVPPEAGLRAFATAPLREAVR